MAHIRQSRPDPDLGLQVKHLKLSQFLPFRSASATEIGGMLDPHMPFEKEKNVNNRTVPCFVRSPPAAGLLLGDNPLR